MTWLAWRQFRLPAGIAAAALAALAVIVVITGRQLVSVYDTNDLAACTPGGTCSGALVDELLNKHSALDGFFRLGLLAAPAVIGIFWGAPLVAREFETGTWRLAWTQSVSRTRWLAVKLGVVGGASMIAAGMLSFMVSWWSRPIDWVAGNRLSPGTFDERGIVAVGYAAFVFALGVTAGLVTRRTLAAMAVTLAVFIGARLAFANWVRPHLWPPAHLSTPLQADGLGFQMTPSGVSVVQGGHPSIPGISNNAWVYSTQIVDSTGRSATQAALHAFVQSACPSIAAGAPPSAGSGPKGIRAANPDAFQACVTQLSTKFHEVVAYQPANRFWMFQWSETAIFIALALVLCGFCFWWIRRGVG